MIISILNNVLNEINKNQKEYRQMNVHEPLFKIKTPYVYNEFAGYVYFEILNNSDNRANNLQVILLIDDQELFEQSNVSIREEKIESQMIDIITLDSIDVLKPNESVIIPYYFAPILNYKGIKISNIHKLNFKMKLSYQSLYDRKDISIIQYLQMSISKATKEDIKKTHKLMNEALNNKQSEQEINKLMEKIDNLEETDVFYKIKTDNSIFRKKNISGLSILMVIVSVIILLYIFF